MIKRSVAVVLAMLYLITASGFAINLHYCGHLLTSVEINAPAKSCTKSPVKMKCCTEKQLQVKIKDAHQSQSFSFLAKIFVFQVPQLPVNTRFFFFNEQPLTATYLNKAPPDISFSATPAFIKNQNFRI